MYRRYRGRSTHADNEEQTIIEIYAEVKHAISEYRDRSTAAHTPFSPDWRLTPPVLLEESHADTVADGRVPPAPNGLDLLNSKRISNSLYQRQFGGYIQECLLTLPYSAQRAIHFDSSHSRGRTAAVLTAM